MTQPGVLAVFFGLGVGLLFLGLASQKPSSRFRRDFYRERRNQLLGLFRPLLFTRVGILFQGGHKSLSQIEIKDLLVRSGNPLGIKPEHVQLARIILSLISLTVLTLIYGFQFLLSALQRLLVPQSLQLAEARSTGLPILLCLFFIVFAYFLPVYLLKYLARRRDNKVKDEQGTFTETIFTLLRVKQPIRVALEEAIKTTDFLKPYIQVCLNEWHTDRIRALQNLKKNVGVARFDLVIDTLIQAATLGDDKTADFLEENKTLEDELVNLSISANSKIRPILMTFQMIIPLLIVFLVLFYPAMRQVKSLLYSIPW